MNSNNPNYVHPDYAVHSEQIKITQDIYYGIDKAKEYLKPRPLEDKMDFMNRKSNATIDNFIEKLVTIQSGLVNRKPLVYDTSKKIQDKLQALQFDTFIKDATTAAARDGWTYVMIDVPKEGGEPYFLQIDRQNVINWEFIGNTKNLKWVLIREAVATTDETGFVTEYKEQYRKIEDHKVTIYCDVQGSLSEVEVIPTQLPMSVSVIKLQDVPPLYDIAKINIQHMNVYSVLDESTMTAMIPSLFTKGLGLDKKDKIKFSTGATINTDNTDAEIKWIELQGSSIPYGVDNLKRKEELMQERGSKFISDTMKSATQVQSENIEQNSRLTSIAQEVNRSIKTIIDIFCEINGAKGEVKVEPDFKVSIDQALIQPLSMAVTQGNLSLETFLLALQEAEVIKIDSVKEELKRIKEQYDEFTVEPTVLPTDPRTDSKTER